MGKTNLCQQLNLAPCRSATCESVSSVLCFLCQNTEKILFISLDLGCGTSNECAEAFLGRTIPLRTSVETVMLSRGFSCVLTGNYLEDTTRFEDSMDFLGEAVELQMKFRHSRLTSSNPSHL